MWVHFPQLYIMFYIVQVLFLDAYTNLIKANVNWCIQLHYKSLEAVYLNLDTCIERGYVGILGFFLCL